MAVWAEIKEKIPTIGKNSTKKVKFQLAKIEIFSSSLIVYEL
jgi:hypothetical protein